MRKRVHAKYGGRCAYCGDKITLKQMHVDHKKPIFRNWGTNHSVPAHAGTDTIDNMMPSCAPCNLWKKTFTVEQFRDEIAKQLERVRVKSGGFRLAERFNQVEATGKPVLFWFERCPVACITDNENAKSTRIEGDA